MLPENKRNNRLRLAGRWLTLVMAVVLTWPRTPDSWTWVLLPAISPYVAAGSALALKAITALTGLAVPVLILVWLFPRWFCRHVCPTGFVQEMIERLRPSANRRWTSVPSIGKGLVFLTFGGAVAGYPLFLWLDPLPIFNAFWAAWRKPFNSTTLITGLGLPLLLVLAFIFPRLWCQRLCPLGATQDLLAMFRRWIVPRSHVSGQFPSRDCPELKADPRRYPATRRAFLVVLLGTTSPLLVKAVHPRSSSPLRPPGAVDQTKFSGVCVRCGHCAQVCPSHIIEPSLSQYGWSHLLTPVLHFDQDYCREDCHRCTQVCPSGALARLSRKEKQQYVIGRAMVDLDQCLLAAGKECTACIRRCPYSAVSLRTTQDGFATEPQVDRAKCNGCGTCEVVCPTRPRRAIRIVVDR